MDSDTNKSSIKGLGSNSQPHLNTNTPKERSLKAPGSITEQVLVGLLNDVFSSCVFKSVPRIDTDPIKLTQVRSNKEQLYYMISLNWSKPNISIQAISHNFNVFDRELPLSQDDTSKYGQKGSLISLGLFASLQVCLKEPCDSPKIPIYIVKNFINKDINKGGYWAYMCCPVFINPKFNILGNAVPVLKTKRAESSVGNGDTGTEGLEEPTTNRDRRREEDQNDRIARLIKLSSEQLEVISASTILSLLWSMCYTNSYARLHMLCGVLCNEFLNNHSDNLQGLVYLFYLCRRMEIMPRRKLEELILSKFNSMSALELLTVQDVVVLSNALEHTESSSIMAQKISTILYYHVEHMTEECAVYLLTGLVRLNFNFSHNELFTKKLMSRILSVYDEITSSELLEALFNTLSIIPYDVVGYFNELISKTLTRLHKLTANEIGRIGSCYATAVNTSEILEAINGLSGGKTGSEAQQATPTGAHSDREVEGAKPQHKSQIPGQHLNKITQLKHALGGKSKNKSNHIYHCLEHHFRLSFINHKSAELHLLRMIHESVIYSSGFQFSEELKKKGFEYGEEWAYSFSLNSALGNANKSNRKTNVKELEAQANNPAYANSYRMFFLNLIDDCCNNSDLFDTTLIDQVIFSLLTLKIDIGPINEAMLANKGEIVKQPGGIIQIHMVEHINEMGRQYSMARDIMSWSRFRQAGNGSLLILGVEISDDCLYVLSRDKRKLSKAPVEPAAVATTSKSAKDGSGGHEVGGDLKGASTTSKPGISSETRGENGPNWNNTASNSVHTPPISPNRRTCTPNKTSNKVAATPQKNPNQAVEDTSSGDVSARAGTRTAAAPSVNGYSGSSSDLNSVATKTNSNHNVANGIGPNTQLTTDNGDKESDRATYSADGAESNGEEDLQNLLKKLMGLPSSSQIGLNSLYELLKSYQMKGGTQSEGSRGTKDNDSYSEFGSNTRKIHTSTGKGVNSERGCDKLLKNTKLMTKVKEKAALKKANQSKSSDKSKDKQKHESLEGKRYEVFYKVKTSKTVRMELEKREIQIIYKYVKVR